MCPVVWSATDIDALNNPSAIKTEVSRENRGTEPASRHDANGDAPMEALLIYYL